MNKKEVSTVDWLQLFFLAIIWGSSFILIKKSLLGLSPLQLGAFRVGIAGIASIPFVTYYRKNIDWSKWHLFLLIGLCTTGIPSFCFSLAQTKVISSTAGILNALTPIFTMLIGIFMFRQKFESKKILAVLAGFLGASILVFSSNKISSSNNDSNIWYASLILLATICYGINANAVKEYFSKTSSTLVSSTAFFLVGTPLAFYLILSGNVSDIIANNEKHMPFLYVTLLSLLCTVLANIIFYNLVQNTSVLFSSSVTFLIPIIATLWGFLDNESITFYHLLAMACILGAIWILRHK
jgi:drug/metabolite transporter (DMT)-like permease